MNLISFNNESKYTKTGSNIGTVAGLTYGISRCVKNKAFDAKDAFEIVNPAKFKNMSKWQRIVAITLLNTLGVALCAFNGEVVGDIVGSVTEKIANIFKKNQ